MNRIRNMTFTLYPTWSYLTIGRGKPGYVNTYFDNTPTRAARLRAMFQAWMERTATRDDVDTRDEIV